MSHTASPKSSPPDVACALVQMKETVAGMPGAAATNAAMASRASRIDGSAATTGRAREAGSAGIRHG